MNLLSQNQNNIQKKAWANMKVMLDKEMPVETKRRRPLIWFFTFVSIGLIAGLYFYFNNERKIHNLNSIDTTASPIVKLENNSTKNDIVLIDANEKLPIESSVSGGSSNSKKIESQLVISSKTISEPVNDFKYFNAHQTFKNSNTELIQFSKDELLNEELSVKSLEENNEIVSNEGRSIIKIDYLSHLNSFIKNNNDPLQFTLIDNKSENKKSDFNLYLTSGIGTYSLKNIEHWFVGFRTAHRLSNKFRLNSGLYYNIISAASITEEVDEDITNGAPMNTDTKDVSGGFQFDPENDQLFESNTGVNTEKIIINKITYLRLPVLLEYRLNNVFNLYAGAQINYLLNLKSGYSNLNLSYSSNEITFNNNSISRLYPSYTSGIRYEPIKRFNLDISFNYDNKINYSENNSTLSMQLAIAYRL